MPYEVEYAFVTMYSPNWFQDVYVISIKKNKWLYENSHILTI